MKKTYRLTALFILAYLSAFQLSAQQMPNTATDSLLGISKGEELLQPSSVGEDAIKILRKITLKGMFQGHYVQSLSSGVDHKGKDARGEKHSSSTFDVRRMRIQLLAEVTDKIEVTVMANLAEFKTEPKHKVLENAFLFYKHNKYLNFRVGQFTPWVGIENKSPIDVIKTLDFSSQRYAFASNGWGSFQVGVDVSGEVEIGKVPMSYNLALINGNNRNRTDDDSGKQLFLRNEYRISKKYALDIGLNGGWGRVNDRDVYMAAVDLSANIALANPWSLYLQGQVGQGINHDLFFDMEEGNRSGNLRDHVMRGWYVLPNLRYELGKQQLHAIEFSCRYEHWEANKLDRNLRQTLTPALSLEFIKDYKLRLTIALQMNKYQHSIDNTDTYNSNMLITQLQARF